MNSAHETIPTPVGDLRRSPAQMRDWRILAPMLLRNQHRVNSDYASSILRDNLDRTLVYRLKEEICGMVIWIADKKPGMCWLEQIVVDHSFRGRRLSTYMMSDLEELAKESGCSRLESCVHVDNSESIVLHERSGWKRLREENGVYTYAKELPAVSTLVKFDSQRLPHVVRIVRKVAYRVFTWKMRFLPFLVDLEQAFSNFA